MKVIHVVGARPNFMKAAPVLAGIRSETPFEQILVHTGQHYDANMSEIFFEQLKLPRPDFNLEVGSGSHSKQTAEIMIRFEQVLLAQKPELLVVYGDVNSTIATALVAKKMGIKVAHVEAGLRSGDMGMPEEVNRRLTDVISDYYFTPSMDGDENLIREGVSKEKIFFVGNVMIDTLVSLLPNASAPVGLENLDSFALVTLHRPANVDNEATLRNIISIINEVSNYLNIVFPIHPRTLSLIERLSLKNQFSQKVHLIEPAGYLQFLWLQKNSKFVLTDSGGIQEETTYLRVPCLTLRENTERPVTVTEGSNTILGNSFDKVLENVSLILNGGYKKGKIPDLWDGNAGKRIGKILLKAFS